MKYIKSALLGAGAITFSVLAIQASGFARKSSSICQPVDLNDGKPFMNNNGCLPAKGDYSGRLFQVNSNWPTSPPPPLANPPWRAAIGNGTINTGNAAAYANALRAAVAQNARKLILDQANWNPAAAGWYNEPWLGAQREAISGTYAAGEFDGTYFPGTGLDVPFDTHVLTYYDARAAHSLYKVWGRGAMKPTVTPTSGQFAEGSIVVKAAVFAATDRNVKSGWWDAMKGAQAWTLFLPAYDTTQAKQGPWVVGQGFVAQFDIIVKDSASSPQTGWVFTTLVYDKDAPGKDVWDKMVVLGAQWGNDPQATSAGMPLKENWINPAAPKYSTQTLGWGGRLSGPNDGAVNPIAFNGQAFAKYPDSSCMSCHSTAEWDTKTQTMPVFLLPSSPNTFKGNGPPFLPCGDDGKPNPAGAYICSPAPGTAAWMKWFQNRPGNRPMDAGTVAMDFDEVFSFKSLRLWRMATTPAREKPHPTLHRTVGARPHNLYTGAPLKRR